jgi:hypothetical protein
LFIARIGCYRWRMRRFCIERGKLGTYCFLAGARRREREQTALPRLLLQQGELMILRVSLDAHLIVCERSFNPQR